MEIYLSLKKCMGMKEIMQDTWSSKEKKLVKFKMFGLNTYLDSWCKGVIIRCVWISIKNYRHLNWNNVWTIVVTSDNNNNEWNLVTTIDCNNKPTPKITKRKESWKNASTIAVVNIDTIIDYNNETTSKIGRSKERLKNTPTIATKNNVTREEGKGKWYNLHSMDCQKLQGEERGCASHSSFITKC